MHAIRRPYDALAVEDGIADGHACERIVPAMTGIEYQYDPWGNIEAETGPRLDGVEYAYTGREWDPETNLYYYRARYYDPKLGRFISEDPIGFDGGINFYAYVENQPTNKVDPFGESSAVGNVYRLRHYILNTPVPGLKCLLFCVPSTYLDDILTLGAGGVLNKVGAKRAAGLITKRIVPALAVLNAPAYLSCLYVCETTPSGVATSCPTPQPAPAPPPMP